MSNDSDIRPDTIHGDPQAQSYPVFALAHLLGIKLMPRIRGIKDLISYPTEAGVAYENLNKLFSEVIDWKLIETHLPDMLRVADSIKLGTLMLVADKTGIPFAIGAGGTFDVEQVKNHVRHWARADLAVELAGNSQKCMNELSGAGADFQGLAADINKKLIAQGSSESVTPVKVALYVAEC